MCEKCTMAKFRLDMITLTISMGRIIIILIIMMIIIIPIFRMHYALPQCVDKNKKE